MKRNFRKPAKMLAAIISVSMAVTLSAGTAFADSEYDIAKGNSDGSGLIEEEINDEDLITEGPAGMVIPETEEPGSGNEQDGIPEWAVDEEGPSQARLFDKYALPSRFDMREYGWITPVKLQNPWATCWSFGGIAAAESSIISSGLVPEGYPLDLSERHLAWFALKPITEHEDSRQAGEGLYMISDDINAPFNSGGNGLYVSTLFASGVGPVEEVFFPYWGYNKLTTADTMDQCVADTIQSAADAAGISFDEEVAVLEERFGVATYEELYAIVEELILEIPSYSKFDDWSISSVNEEGYSNRNINEGFVLKNANIIPDYRTETGDVSEDAIRAMKQEMVDGRAVSFSYYADASRTYVNTAPFDNTGLYGEGIYGGVEYAQYVDTPLIHDHNACIVGWNDNFSASNFCPDHQPPGDGAWIVKNSWGSETDACPDANGNIVNCAEYGAYNEEGQTTGYFYLSYYDETICYTHVATSPETFEFSDNIANNEGMFYVDQYDYLSSDVGFNIMNHDTLMSTANIFTAYENLDLISTSTRTASPNTRVTYAIYLLDEDATLPDQGTLLYRRSVNYEYGGFHRLDLDKRIHFNQGQRYSVITTSALLDGETGSAYYQVTATQSLQEETAIEVNYNTYARKVVNEGESFIYYRNNITGEYVWEDWKEISAQLEDDIYEQYQMALLIDNFSIKAYSVPAEFQPVDISGAEVTGIIDKTYTGSAIIQDFTVSYDGKELTEGSDYEVEYYDNTNAGTATVVITGINYYGGSSTHTFMIDPAPITSASVTRSSYYYKNGNPVKPVTTVVVKGYAGGKTVALTRNIDYKLSYKNNVNVGTATLTVTGKGNYTGTKNVNYKIVPTKRSFSVVKGGKGSLTLKWIREKAQATGYQYQYSTTSDFSSGVKSVKVKISDFNTRLITQTVKNLKTGKTYYVRLRPYSDVDGKTYYSEWSDSLKAKAAV